MGRLHSLPFQSLCQQSTPKREKKEAPRSANRPVEYANAHKSTHFWERARWRISAGTKKRIASRRSRTSSRSDSYQKKSWKHLKEPSVGPSCGRSRCRPVILRQSLSPCPGETARLMSMHDRNMRPEVFCRDVHETCRTCGAESLRRIVVKNFFSNSALAPDTDAVRPFLETIQC